MGASIALLAISPGFYRGWARRHLAGAAIFGIATALMNLFFYLGINHIDLGKSVAIEFLGPIAVAAATTRTTRNAGVGARRRRRGHARRSRARRRARRVLHPALVRDVGAVHRRRVAGGTGPPRRGRARRGLAIGTIAITPVGRRRAGRCGRRRRCLILCCLTGVFSNAIGYGIDQYVLRRIPVRRFSVLLALLPVTALVVGWIALDQQPSALDIVGMLAVLAGVALQSEQLPTGVAQPEPS